MPAICKSIADIDIRIEPLPQPKIGKVNTMLMRENCVKSHAPTLALELLSTHDMAAVQRCTVGNACMWQ